MPSADEQPRFAGLLRGLVSRLLLVALSLAFCEGFLRTIGYPNWLGTGDMPSFQEADSELGWTNRPGKYLLTVDGLVVHIAIAEDGTRVTSHHPPAGASSDVAVLGDSFVYGYGLSDGETFPWKLQDAFPGWNFRNYGVPRWGTSQSYLQMKKILRSGDPPALFIYLFNVFHETRNIGEPVWMRVNTAREGSDLNFPYFRIGPDGELVEHRSPGLTIPPLGRLSRLVILADELWNLTLAKSRLSEAREVTKKLLVRMENEARKAGSKFLVVPFAGDAEQFRDYEELAMSDAVRMHDCSTPLSQLERFQLPDGHPNGAMNSILAECIGWRIPELVSGG